MHPLQSTFCMIRIVFHSKFLLTYRVNWVTVEGMTFKSSAVVMLGVVGDLPQFGEVVEVYVVGGNRVLLCTR